MGVRAELTVCLEDGSVRVEGEGGEYSKEVRVVVLDRGRDEVARVKTSYPGDVRKLAWALNRVADFIEAG